MQRRESKMLAGRQAGGMKAMQRPPRHFQSRSGGRVAGHQFEVSSKSCGVENRTKWYVGNLTNCINSEARYMKVKSKPNKRKVHI
jgi:hypothetical protein